MNFWLGWLLKGRCEISILDVLIFSIELVTVVMLIFGWVHLLEKVRKWRKR